MKVIYIAGPFRGKNAWKVEQNIRKAEEAGFKVASIGGVMPMIPHTMTRFFDGTMTDEFWLQGTLELLARCDAILMLPGWENSSGSRNEKKFAEQNKLPVFYDRAAIKEWLSTVSEHNRWPQALG